MDSIVFDQFYRDYDSWYHTKIGAFVDTIETETAFRLLQPQNGEKILDLGCGTGNFSLKLSKMGCQVTGVDISRNMLNLAREKASRLSSSARFLEMNGYQLQFEDQSFDSVLSMAAFEFISQPEIVFKELWRVIKPGGFIVIGTIQKGGAWAQLYSSDLCKGTAYEQAQFKEKEELIALSPQNLTAEDECLFIPPGLPEEEYNLQTEKMMRKKEKIGGFLCVAFQKTV